MSNKAPVWFVEFEKKNDARWNRQEKFNKEMTEFKTEVISRLNNLEKDVRDIKNCPTIKAELQQTN